MLSRWEILWLIITKTPCGGKRGNFQLQVDKTGAQGNYMTSWGPLASRKQKRTLGPEHPTLLSPDRALWPQQLVSEPRGCLLRPVSWWWRIYPVVLCLVAQLCPTLRDPMGCSPPGSSVHGILQVRILEWVAMTSSRGSSQPRD